MHCGGCFDEPFFNEVGWMGVYSFTLIVLHDNDTDTVWSSKLLTLQSYPLLALALILRGVACSPNTFSIFASLRKNLV